jgi:hypothetical protein
VFGASGVSAGSALAATRPTVTCAPAKGGDEVEGSAPGLLAAAAQSARCNGVTLEQRWLMRRAALIACSHQPIRHHRPFVD